MPEKHYLLLINPAAGKHLYQQKLDKARDFLKLNNLSFQVYITEKVTPELHLKKFLTENSSFTDIIIVGGDGTINLTINGVPHFRYRLGFLSNGTGNDSVKPLHIPSTTELQLQTILTGNTAKADLGQCNGRYFMNGVGIGFDGEVVNEMSKRNKKRKGHWAYLSVVLKIITGRWSWPVSISLDDQQIQLKIFSITIAKGTTFGGGFVMNPNAKNNDGLLDVCVFNHLGLLKRLYILPMVQLGIHGKAPDVQFHKCRSLRISSPTVLNAHIDGEPLQSREFQIAVVPQAINVVV